MTLLLGCCLQYLKLAARHLESGGDVDYQEPQGGFRPVKITYAWHEDGNAKTHDHVVRQPQETYTIDCGPKTMAKSVSVELVP
jgi:hypothetical protein